MLLIEGRLGKCLVEIVLGDRIFLRGRLYECHLQGVGDSS